MAPSTGVTTTNTAIRNQKPFALNVPHTASSATAAKVRLTLATPKYSGTTDSASMRFRSH